MTNIIHQRIHPSRVTVIEQSAEISEHQEELIKRKHNTMARYTLPLLKKLLSPLSVVIFVRVVVNVVRRPVVRSAW